MWVACGKAACVAYHLFKGNSYQNTELQPAKTALCRKLSPNKRFIYFALPV